MEKSPHVVPSASDTPALPERRNLISIQNSEKTPVACVKSQSITPSDTFYLYACRPALLSLWLSNYVDSIEYDGPRFS